MLVDEPQRYAAMTDAFAAEIDKERARLEPRCDAEGKPLFLDERGELVTEPYHHRQRVDARGAALFRAPGKLVGHEQREGFTSSELWDLHFHASPNGLRRLEAWTDNPANRFVALELREVVKQPAEHAPEHVAARRHQLEVLLADIAEFAAAVAALAGDDHEPLWSWEPRGADVRDRLATAGALLETTAERVRGLHALVSALPVRSR